MPRSCQGDLRIIILRDQCCFHSCSFVILHQCYVVIRTGVKNAQMYPPSRRTTAFHNVNYILSIDISVSGQSGHYQSPCARFDYLIQLIKSNVVSCRSVGAWGAHAAVYSSVVCQSFDPVIELFSRHMLCNDWSPDCAYTQILYYRICQSLTKTNACVCLSVCLSVCLYILK